MGKKGKKDKQMTPMEKLETNTEKAKTVCEHIYIQLFLALKVKTKEIKLKATFTNSFEGIFIIPAKDFFSSERYDVIYKLADKIVRDNNTKDFNISILFMPHSKKINEEAFYADGFHLTFGIRDNG